MQAWGALLLLVMFLVVFVRASPYEHTWLNDLERDALSTDAITLFFGLALFLNDTNASDGQSDVLATMLTLSIIGINVWFVVRVVRELRLHSAYGSAVMRLLSPWISRCSGSGASRGGREAQEPHVVPNPYYDHGLGESKGEPPARVMQLEMIPKINLIGRVDLVGPGRPPPRQPHPRSAMKHARM